MLKTSAVSYVSIFTSRRGQNHLDSGLKLTMTRSLRKRQREDVAKSEDGSRVAGKRKKRSAPLAPTKPPADSESHSHAKTPPQTDTSPQSKPQHQPLNRDEDKNQAHLSRNGLELISPLSSRDTRPSTPQRPLARAQPNTPPIPHEVWAKILYYADFGSKVCERFEQCQLDRAAKYGDLVVQAFPAHTPREAKEVFWLAQKELKWMEFGQRWNEMLARVMSVTPDDECNDAEGR
jgi:hypothetical protein